MPKSNHTADDPAVLSIIEVAQLMNKPENTVRKWAREGHFGAYKEGTAYVFPADRLDTLSVDDVAEWLQLNVQTVRRWAREGLYPTIKLGRRYYFSRKVLMAGLHQAEAAIA